MDKKTLKEISYLPDTSSFSVIAQNTVSGKKIYVTHIILFNDDSSNRKVYIHKVPNSGGATGTPIASNKFVEKTITAKDTLLLEFTKFGIKLDELNDTIQANAEVADKITVQVYGFEE